MTRMISARADCRNDNAQESREPRPRERRNTSAKLTEKQREYVVHRLAAFDSPSEVQRGLLAEFDVWITRPSVQFYDPTTHAGRRLSEKWRSLFYATREALCKGSAAIGACHALVRIRRREQLMLRAMEMDNLHLANAILDSIAREVGDCFGSKYDHAVPRVPTLTLTGRPGPSETRTHEGCTIIYRSAAEA